MTEAHQNDQLHDEGQTGHQVNCSRPGELLKKAREARGLSQAEVARKLNFMPTYVPALENEDFSQLHSTTFIKGYIRAYARFVGINPEEVLNCFAAHYPEMHKEEKIQPVETLKPEKSSHLIFKLFTLVVIAALITIIILWWQSRSTETLPEVTSQEVQVETLDGQTILAPITLAEPEPEPPTPEAAATGSPELSVSQPTVAPPAPSVTTAPRTTIGTGETSTGPTQPEVAPVRTITGDPALATLGNGRLVALTFTGDCWLEVRDNTDRILHANLMRAGDAILLEGEPPFRMVFGYGHVAEVFYRGTQYDFSSRIRSNGYAAIRVE
ncbi:RodZ domain-containing protein [Marinospirillum alkaliphilum]|uniref:Cytoskeleton protein RodZ n=1 Tax=Marinospirillum alkaliphilum DSM 21637 TaxID=1122209 RepID=A0A1K1UXK8_9GAMM|nr:RodZ domain-containing protein [Marinospirillum alkaliphilum]SFX17559.1 cytoskeleton protein RodZ [Marinospirillum alkaliphilum DSM 21637]